MNHPSPSFNPESIIKKLTHLIAYFISPGKIDGIWFLDLHFDSDEMSDNPTDLWTATVTYEKGIPVEITWMIFNATIEEIGKHIFELLGNRYYLVSLFEHQKYVKFSSKIQLTEDR